VNRAAGGVVGVEHTSGCTECRSRFPPRVHQPGSSNGPCLRSRIASAGSPRVLPSGRPVLCPSGGQGSQRLLLAGPCRMGLLVEPCSSSCEPWVGREPAPLARAGMARVPGERSPVRSAGAPARLSRDSGEAMWVWHWPGRYLPILLKRVASLILTISPLGSLWSGFRQADSKISR
jgi:hypothetical protein